MHANTVGFLAKQIFFVIVFVLIQKFFTILPPPRPSPFKAHVPIHRSTFTVIFAVVKKSHLKEVEEKLIMF